MANTIERYYDDETGREIVYGYADEVSIQTLETLEEWREQKALREKRKGPVRYYVNCYHDSTKVLSDSLAVNELGALMKLIPYIRFNSGGHLYYGEKRMTATLAAKAIGKGKRWTDELLAKLTEQGVLFKEKDKRYMVYGINEAYHSIGGNIRDVYYTKVYQVKTRTDIANLKIQSAGVLYKMLPYFNYRWCCLCINPQETDKTKIKHMSHRQFAELFGVDRNVVDRAVKELIRFGFIATMKLYEVELYVVNPDIMYRQRNEYTPYAESLRALFQIGEQCTVQISDAKLPF